MGEKQYVYMTKSGLPQSLRKYVRFQKAKIRGEVFDSQKQKEMINKLYSNVVSTVVKGEAVVSREKA